MISRKRLSLAAAALTVFAAVLAPAPAEAQIDLDLRAGLYTDVEEAFIGAGILTAVTGNWYFNPNVEYVFVDRGSLWTLNGDFHYDFAQRTNWTFWAGAGPALIFRDFDDRRRRDDSETDFGVNLLAGVGMVRGAVRPYGQFKIILSDDTEAVVALGLRF
ncbi:MAG TPA: hypothetical protein VLF66_20025 [Thermoanaerobaculia bacterium]|nr:hypothetical protein [Thermoanaerobaculia bacterium]